MDLAADLPAPRDDEPADLRRDILDELADHLHCAVDRERQRAVLNGDEAAAQSQDHLWPRVVARFGHPARIARQLWWDAMKEKIMSQRTQTATLVVMSLFCVAMMIVTFMSLADSRQLARDNQNLNKELLAQLEELASRPAATPASAEPVSTDPAEWNQLQFKCVWGSEDGEPIEGAVIFLESESENTAGIPTSDEVTNAEGIADFGKVLYGTYSVFVRTPNHLTSQQSVAVRPGQDKLMTIVCPQGDALSSVSLQPQFDWTTVPESLKDRVWIYCVIHADERGLGLGQWDVDYEYEWPAALRDNGGAFDEEFNGAYDIGTFLINAKGQILLAGNLDRGPAELNSSQLLRVANSIFELPEAPSFFDSIELPPGGYQIYSAVLIGDPAEADGRRLLAIEGIPRNGDSQVYFGGGAPTAFDNMRSQMDRAQFESRRGGSPMGGGWSSGPRSQRDGSLPLQLGQLPMSFVLDALPQLNSFPSPMGRGGGGSSQPQYLVQPDGQQTWEFPVDASETLFLADLALRVPLDMNIHIIAPHILKEDNAAIVPGSIIDVVWKGLMVDSDGNVVPEDHVLVTGLDVVANGQKLEQEEFILKELYVPLAADEMALLLAGAVQPGLTARPSAEPVRRSSATTIDPTLLERISNHAIQTSWAPGQASGDWRQVWLDVEGGSIDQFQQGLICDIDVYTKPVDVGDPDAGTTRIALLHDRIVSAGLGSQSAPDDQVGLIVSAGEAAVIERAREFGKVVAIPSPGPSDVAPLQENPNLEEVLETIELIRTTHAAATPVE